MFKVEYELMGDARVSTRVFASFPKAHEWQEYVFMDGGDARIVKVAR